VQNESNVAGLLPAQRPNGALEKLVVNICEKDELALYTTLSHPAPGDAPDDDEPLSTTVCPDTTKYISEAKEMDVMALLLGS
jgi:hypothetical protein